MKSSSMLPSVGVESTLCESTAMSKIAGYQ